MGWIRMGMGMISCESYHDYGRWTDEIDVPKDF